MITALRQRVTHGCAVLAAAGSLALDDPTWFLVQAGRTLPAAVRTRLGAVAVRSGGTVAAWGHLLMDQPGRAREVLASGHRGRLGDALALHAGLPPSSDSSQHAARWGWLTGDLATAEAAATEGSTRQRRRALGDIAALEPGPRPAPSAVRTWPADGRPRVLHVLTNSLPWTRSGYTMRSHDILTAQRAAGLHVTALTRPGYPATIGKWQSGPEDTLDGITYHRSMPLPMHPGEAGRIDQWAVDLIALARREQLTHLHSTTHYPTGLAAQSAATALDLPWVHEVRGQLERTWASRRVNAGDVDPYVSSRYLRWRAREAEVAAAADHVVTLSGPMRADLIERGVAADRITVIPNGIGEEVLGLPTDAAAVRARDGLPREGTWVGAVTSVVHYEGLSVLLEAVALARADGTDVRAAIVGDGLAWPDLARQVQRLGLSEVVLLPGRVPREQARRWLARLDVVAVPRQRHEVTQLVPPLKVMEAMGAARPVIVSALPALTEIVQDGHTGLVVNPGAPEELARAVQRLAAEEHLRRSLAEAGRQQATRHTWPELVRRYQKIYQEVSRA
ncbi:glycosyltransferase family 4 protein [Ornithinimicrobium murale]|uniref:glycosyltransferase family 4 protein n=1 Tax=Ornithinimicrobium murale TaxID=1050153 RepID=UPI000E0DE3EE|nr:glycosyltransferase family 4 protein [Ornithinimicrobium murale]